MKGFILLNDKLKNISKQLFQLPCLSVHPFPSISVRPFWSVPKITSAPAGISHNVTNKSYLVCVKSENMHLGSPSDSSGTAAAKAKPRYVQLRPTKTAEKPFYEAK